MRTLQALAIVCLLFYGVTAEPAEGKSHQLGLRQHLERAKTCSIQCVPGPGSDNSSKNWVIRLDVNIYLLYSAEYNYLAIYNVNLGIAVVYDSVNSILIVVNVKTGDSLLIRFQIALFVKGSGAITQFDNETGVYDGIDLCYQIIVKYRVQVVSNTSTTTGGFFSVTILLQYLLNLNGEIDLTTVVNGRTDLAIQLKAGFGIYFQSVSVSLKRGDFLISRGAFVLVGIVFDVSKTGSSNAVIYQFFYVLYFKQIVITIDIINDFYLSITTNNSNRIADVNTLLANVGVLYDSTTSAWIAFKAGYFSYLRATVTINGQASDIVFSRDSNTKDWNIVIESSRTAIAIIYYRKLNVLVFVNVTYNLVFVFPAKGSVYTIYNGATGVAIAISKLLGTAKVIDGNAAKISAAYISGNLILAIRLMYEETVATTIKIWQYNFLFVDFLNSIRKDGADYKFRFNSATKAKIDANFKALIVNYKGIEGFVYLEGSVNGLLIIFKGFNLGFLPRQLILLVSFVCLKSNILFNGSILDQVYFSIEINVKFSFSVKYIFTFLPGQGGGGVTSSSSSSGSYSSGGSSSYSVGSSSYSSGTSIIYGSTYTSIISP